MLKCNGMHAQKTSCEHNKRPELPAVTLTWHGSKYEEVRKNVEDQCCDGWHVVCDQTG